ncbi:uncharacterized protein LOC129733763, partial [Wyeomyia smithii]|uniref:uncharacterized protein LOC129733763 n=1 Tax=Wyeomyia smithii TaxID=174621 RepID=UPI002467E249
HANNLTTPFRSNVRRRPRSHIFPATPNSPSPPQTPGKPAAAASRQFPILRSLLNALADSADDGVYSRALGPFATAPNFTPQLLDEMTGLRMLLDTSGCTSVLLDDTHNQDKSLVERLEQMETSINQLRQQVHNNSTPRRPQYRNTLAGRTTPSTPQTAGTSQNPAHRTTNSHRFPVLQNFLEILSELSDKTLYAEGHKLPTTDDSNHNQQLLQENDTIVGLTADNMSDSQNDTLNDRLDRIEASVDTMLKQFDQLLRRTETDGNRGEPAPEAEENVEPGKVQLRKNDGM